MAARCLSILAFAALAFSMPRPVFADDIAHRYILSQPNSPIDIGNCAIGYDARYNTLDDYIGTDITVNYEFVNVTAKPIVAVRFGAAAYDTFGALLYSTALDVKGTFSKNAWINRNDGLALRVPNLSNIDTALCFVQAVKYQDGSVWFIDGNGPPKTFVPPAT